MIATPTQPTRLAGDPFKGQTEQINADQYMTGGRKFGPFIISANITPDAQGRPAGLTFDGFVTLLRTEHDAPVGTVLQVMPWPVFGRRPTTTCARFTNN